VERLVGNSASRIAMSSTKSSIGHLLGAAGAVRRSSACLALRDQVVPPTINLDNPSVETPIDLVPHKRAAARSTWRCQIRLASAAPMLRSCFRRLQE
jgi:3-oxoacyl-[acyl-carrier-protein] synthase II